MIRKLDILENSHIYQNKILPQIQSGNDWNLLKDGTHIRLHMHHISWGSLYASATCFYYNSIKDSSFSCSVSCQLSGHIYVWRLIAWLAFISCVNAWKRKNICVNAWNAFHAWCVNIEKIPSHFLWPYIVEVENPSQLL